MTAPAAMRAVARRVPSRPVPGPFGTAPLRAALLAACLWAAPVPATAHQLSVFATVEDGIVTIEARFADGSPVAAGRLRILGPDGAVLHQQDVGAGFPVDFPVGDHRDGLRIEVDAGHGHSNYWLLTPADLDGAASD